MAHGNFAGLNHTLTLGTYRKADYRASMPDDTEDLPSCFLETGAISVQSGRSSRALPVSDETCLRGGCGRSLTTLAEPQELPRREGLALVLGGCLQFVQER